MDNSKHQDLDPSPCMTTILFSHTKVSLMAMVNIKVYQRVYFMSDNVTYVSIFILYVYL